MDRVQRQLALTEFGSALDCLAEFQEPASDLSPLVTLERYRWGDVSV